MNTATTTETPDLFAIQPDKASRDVAWLEGLLRGAGCWMTAGDILLSIAWPQSDSNKRWLRELASQTTCIISGQKGYRHAKNATAEEIVHSSNWLISQGKLMIQRGIGQRRAAHKIFG